MHSVDEKALRVRIFEERVARLMALTLTFAKVQLVEAIFDADNSLNLASIILQGLPIEISTFRLLI